MLLAYLATESDRAHPRSTLAEMFWPERSNEDALKSLRYALSNLQSIGKDRKGLPPILAVTRSQVQFNPDGDFWVDVVAFQAQAMHCETAVANGVASVVKGLQTALEGYKGKFLQGSNLGDSLDFETWALNKRDQFERLYLRLLKMLAAALEAEGKLPQAEEACRKILESQPWDENTHQKLMHLLAASGQYAVALAQYDACCLTLSQLGIEPGRETNLLYRRIKQKWTAPNQKGDFSAKDQWNETAESFVGRAHELKKLLGFLSRMLAGQGQIALITGEAGSGKTALLNEFARQSLAHHPNLVVVAGRCDAYAGLGQPYQPFVEILKMLSGEWETLPWFENLPEENRARLNAILPTVAEVLVRAAPGLLARFIHGENLARRLQDHTVGMQGQPNREKTSPKGLTPSANPAYLETGILFEQITRFMIEISRQRSLVVLLDDIQWIDPGSAALLFHLIRQMGRHRILILAAYRSSAINLSQNDREHPLLGIVTELQRYGGNIRIDLEQSDERGFVSSYLEKDPLLTPNKLDESFRTALARHTGGNPLFTIELLRSLQARGDLHLTSDGFWVSRLTLNWQHLPERVEAAIASRITRLPPKWFEWLLTASVEGENFTAEVLAKVHEVDKNTLIKDLSGALSMARSGYRLIQADETQWLGAENQGGAQLSRYRFRHILFQTYLYQQLDPVERSQRHAAVGFALEELYNAQAGVRTRHAAELARHFDVGGLPQKAASYYLEAGKQAVFLASNQVAIAHYRRGLEVLAEQSHSLSILQLKIRLHLAMGAPFLSSSGWGGPERQQAIQKAVDLLKEVRWMYQEQAKHSEPPTAEQLELLTTIYAQADWLISQGELQKAITLGEELLALAGTEPNRSLALAHRVLGISHLFQGNFLRSRQHLETAIETNAAIGEPVPKWRAEGDLETACRASLGFVLAISGYPNLGQQQIRMALERAHRLKRFSSLGAALIFACEVEILRKDLASLRALADELLQLGSIDTDERRFFRAYGMAVDGYVKTFQAKPKSEQALAGLAALRSGMEIWESTDTRAGLGQWIVHIAAACLHAGQIEAGLEIVNAALADDLSQSAGAGLARIHRLHGELSLMQSQPDEEKAQNSFLKALKIAREQGAHTLALGIAIRLAKLWQAAQPKAARQLLEEIYMGFTEGDNLPAWQEAQTLLAELTQN